MRKEDCFELGYITTLHGLKGDLVLHLDVDFPEDYQGLESVFVDMNHNLVPFFIDALRLKGNKATISFEDVNSIEEAESLKGKAVFLPLSFLPKLPEGQFYYHEVIGYQVVDQTLGEIGEVLFFNDGSAQTIMVFDHKGHEVLVPVIDEILLKADHSEKQLQVNLPEGLLDVYLEE